MAIKSKYLNNTKRLEAAFFRPLNWKTYPELIVIYRGFNNQGGAWNKWKEEADFQKNELFVCIFLVTQGSKSFKLPTYATSIFCLTISSWVTNIYSLKSTWSIDVVLTERQFLNTMLNQFVPGSIANIKNRSTTLASPT